MYHIIVRLDAATMPQEQDQRTWYLNWIRTQARRTFEGHDVDVIESDRQEIAVEQQPRGFAPSEAEVAFRQSEIRAIIYRADAMIASGEF